MASSNNRSTLVPAASTSSSSSTNTGLNSSSKNAIAPLNINSSTLPGVVATAVAETPTRVSIPQPQHQLHQQPTPILKVMRLQAPDLSCPSAGSLGTSPLPSPALSLPDSFGIIHIGETFTAYLGILNPSPVHSISQLSAVVQLKTPTRDHITLPCHMDTSSTATAMIPSTSLPPSKGGGGVTLAPLQFVNAIVSRSLEEVGEHSLRVEVLYSAGPGSGAANPSGSSRTLRKFYRFQVSSPLNIRNRTVRGGDSSCFVSITIENATEGTTLVVSGVDFVPTEGLEAIKIMGRTELQPWIHSMDYTMRSSPPRHPNCQQQPPPSPHNNPYSQINCATNNTNSMHDETTITTKTSAVDLLDSSGRLTPGSSFRYLFHIRAVSPEAQTRGIAVGDALGKAVVTWFKTMGEAGQMVSTEVICPPSYPPSLLQQQAPSSCSSTNSSSIALLSQSGFVMYKSGLSVDVAASAADKSDGYITNETTTSNPTSNSTTVTLDDIFPVTVDPIDPPTQMTLGTSYSATLCIINHSDVPLNLQLQFRLADMFGVVISGKSFINVGEVGGYGGSAVTQVQMLPLMPGLCQVTGCYVVDLNSGKEIGMPPLFDVFVTCKSSTSSKDF